MDVAFPATMIVPVALFGNDMLESTVVVGVTVGLDTPDVLCVSAIADTPSVLVGTVGWGTGVGLRGPLVVMPTVV